MLMRRLLVVSVLFLAPVARAHAEPAASGRYAWMPGRCLWFSNLTPYDCVQNGSPFANFSAGTYSVTGDVIQLEQSPKIDEDQPGPSFAYFSELHIVRWGPREYLIPEIFLYDFVDAINAGVEPRRAGQNASGYFFLRRGDASKPCEGRPQLAAKYASGLLSAPATGRVVAVGESYARLSVPRGHALKSGTWLYGAHTLMVHDVRDTEVDAGARCCNGLPPVKVGDVLHTRYEHHGRDPSHMFEEGFTR